MSDDDRERIATGYRRFAGVEAVEASAVYPRLALAVADDPDEDEARGRFLLSMDGRPVAWTAPHDGRVDWIAGTPR